MRITNITPQYFTRFRDDNARKVIREVFTAPPEEDYMQGCYDHRFDLYDNCEFGDVFTSSEDSKIKIEFDKEFIKEHDLEYYIEDDTEEMEDLGNYKNASLVSYSLDSMYDKLAGIKPQISASDDRYYETEEEQQERRLSYLAQ